MVFFVDNKIIKKGMPLDNDEAMNFKEEINKSLNSIFVDVDSLISELKHKSSEEILNGSVTEAQKLLKQILPYQNFYEKLVEAQKELSNMSQVSLDNIILAKEKLEALDQEEINKQVEKSKSKNGITPHINYRIPILKALIFLGGNPEVIEVTEFIKKEMKKKFTKEDLEIPEGEEKERWMNSLYMETSIMIDEGLLSNKTSENSWEIAQKGIDYLSKFTK